MAPSWDKLSTKLVFIKKKLGEGGEKIISIQGYGGKKDLMVTEN